MTVEHTNYRLEPRPHEYYCDALPAELSGILCVEPWHYLVESQNFNIRHWLLVFKQMEHSYQEMFELRTECPHMAICVHL